MLILTVIGARPQFIKSSMVSRALRNKGVKKSCYIQGSIMTKICPTYFLMKWVFLNQIIIWVLVLVHWRANSEKFGGNRKSFNERKT